MIRLLNMIAIRISVLYVIAVIASLVFSQMLPSFEAVRDQRIQSCYWTSAMRVLGECVPEAFATSLRTSFYNFWLYFIYFPMFMSWKTIVIYAPVVFLVFQLLSRLRRRSL